MESIMAKVISTPDPFLMFQTAATRLGARLPCDRREKKPQNRRSSFTRSISEVHVCTCVRVQSLTATHVLSCLGPEHLKPPSYWPLTYHGHGAVYRAFLNVLDPDWDKTPRVDMCNLVPRHNMAS